MGQNQLPVCEKCPAPFCKIAANVLRLRGYKTFFMLNSAEHEIFTADEYGIVIVISREIFYALLCLGRKKKWDLLAGQISCIVELSIKKFYNLAARCIHSPKCNRYTFRRGNSNNWLCPLHKRKKSTLTRKNLLIRANSFLSEYTLFQKGLCVQECNSNEYTQHTYIV